MWKMQGCCSFISIVHFVIHLGYQVNSLQFNGRYTRYENVFSCPNNNRIFINPLCKHVCFFCLEFMGFIQNLRILRFDVYLHVHVYPI